MTYKILKNRFKLRSGNITSATLFLLTFSSGFLVSFFTLTSGFFVSFLTLGSVFLNSFLVSASIFFVSNFFCEKSKLL